MTTEPRRDPPRSIEDVIERNYSVVGTKGLQMFSSRIDRLMKWYVHFRQKVDSWDLKFD